MYIGNSEGRICNVSSQADNGSVIITGKSGSGKSCRMNAMELAEVERGNTVIVIDISRNHQEHLLLPEIRNRYMNRVNRIEAIKDGLGLGILNALTNTSGEQESVISVINSNVTAFSATHGMGERQQAILRTAITHAIQIQRKYNCSDADALLAVFEYHNGKKGWDSVYQKLWTVLNCNALQKGNKSLVPHSINVIDLGGLDVDNSAVQLAEVIIAYIWRVARSGFPASMGKIVLVIDEFQNLNLGVESTLRKILCEGRKFGLNLLLVTQTLDRYNREIKSMLDQAASHLYFHPVDSDMLSSARAIDPLNPKAWIGKLANLRRGESVATGLKEICGVTIARPLIIK